MRKNNDMGASADANGVHPVEVSMHWFEWVLDCALEHAISVHGIDARGFAWTTSKEFKHLLPDGYALLYASEGVALPEADAPEGSQP